MKGQNSSLTFQSFGCCRVQSSNSMRMIPIYWKVWQENRTSLMKIDAKCKKSEMLFINYEAPDGQKRYEHLWNGGTGEARIRLYEKTLHGLYLVDDIDATHVGCEAGEYDR